MKYRKRVLFLSFAAALARAPVGCSSQSTPQPIWFGHVANLSGPETRAGQAAARGIRLAVEEVDKDPSQGVGRPFKVIHADTRAKLESFESEATRLTALNHVAFLLGGTTLEEVERLERARVPVLSPLGGSCRPTGDGVFFTGLAAPQRAKVLARFAVQELGAAGVALVVDDATEEAPVFADIFVRDFRAAWALKNPKISPVIRRLALPKGAQVKGLADNLQDVCKRDGIEALVLAAHSESLLELGPAPTNVLLAIDDGRQLAFDVLPGTGRKLFHLTAFHTDSAPAKEFAQRYQQAYQDEADEHAALAYESMKLLAEALWRAKDDLKLDNIKVELGKIKDFPGLTGLLTFTEARQLKRPVFVVRQGPGGREAVKRISLED